MIKYPPILSISSEISVPKPSLGTGGKQGFHQLALALVQSPKAQTEALSRQGLQISGQHNNQKLNCGNFILYVEGPA